MRRVASINTINRLTKVQVRGPTERTQWDSARDSCSLSIDDGVGWDGDGNGEGTGGRCHARYGCPGRL